MLIGWQLALQKVLNLYLADCETDFDEILCPGDESRFILNGYQWQKLWGSSISETTLFSFSKF